MVVCPADKGGFVILRKEDYKRELNRLVDNIIIYQIPKVYKNQTNPPGRPIISVINSISSRLGEYLDTYLQPLVQQYPAYLRDSKHLINMLENFWVDDNIILATVDVESLYTNILQDDARRAVKWALNERSQLKLSQQTFILEALEFAMECNYFWHDWNFYRQHKGVAMGVRYVFSVANSFLSKWKDVEKFGKPRLELEVYKRYIDYVLIVWKGSEENLKAFLDEININAYSITFMGG